MILSWLRVSATHARLTGALTNPFTTQAGHGECSLRVKVWVSSEIVFCPAPGGLIDMFIGIETLGQALVVFVYRVDNINSPPALISSLVLRSHVGRDSMHCFWMGSLVKQTTDPRLYLLVLTNRCFAQAYKKIFPDNYSTEIRACQNSQRNVKSDNIYQFLWPAQ